MATCGKMIRNFENILMPCLRKPGHPDGHCNPYSDSYPFPEKKNSETETEEQ